MTWTNKPARGQRRGARWDDDDRHAHHGPPQDHEHDITEGGARRRHGGPHRGGGPHGAGGGRRGGGRGRGGRAPRGEIRVAILLLLAEEPMHGYQLMQQISERSGGHWTPSPGAIYPTISQLEDEGLVSITRDAGRKLVTLTESGQAHVTENRDSWTDPMSAVAAENTGPDLRDLVHQLHGAVRQVERAGTDPQRERAAEILTESRRSLYLLLAEES